MIILYVFIIVAIVFTIMNEYEKRQIEINEYVIESTKIKIPKEYIVISDLHGCFYKKNSNLLLEQIKKTNVKDVIIAGDIINGDLKSDWNKTIEFMEELSLVFNLYYVEGNHEQRMREGTKTCRQKYEGYYIALKKCGVHFLENSSFDDGKICITGLQIPKIYYKKKYNKPLLYEDICCVTGNMDEKKYNILVTHNPRYMDTYMKTKADMIVSGHFHGCMLRLPFIGGVMSTQVDFFPEYDGGIYRKNGKTIIVSRGLGNHFPGFRINNKPEIIKIKLQNLA